MHKQTVLITLSDGRKGSFTGNAIVDKSEENILVTNVEFLIAEREDVIGAEEEPVEEKVAEVKVVKKKKK